MQPDPSVLLAVVLGPFLAAAVTPFVYRYLGERTAYFASAVAAVCFLLVASHHAARGTVTIPWVPALGITLKFYVDGLALLIGYLATGIGVCILSYSRGYMHNEPGGARYYATLLAFMGSMLGVAFAADLIALFVFWELTSVSSYLLIGHYRETRASRYAARKAMLITVAGGLFMLVGFLLLADVVGSYDLAAMLASPGGVQADLRETGRFLPVLVLLAIGAAAKSAQVPLHVWLPNAMEAPTPVSAFLHSATMVKAGVYLVGRFRPLLSSPEWTLLFVALGLLTMTVAAILAVAATDIKELLAYSTASHLGLIIAGFAITSKVGAEAGAFHILNHALFKAALFLVAGIVAHEAGTRALGELGGLRSDLPVTSVVAVIAGLSMAGLPPFNGFYSKELLFDATYELALHDGGLWWLLPAGAVFASVFTVLYSLRFIRVFFGAKPATLGDVHRPPRTMLVPPALLAVLAFVVGLSPGVAIDGIVYEVFVATGGAGEFHVGLPTHLTGPVAMSVVAIVGGVSLFPVLDRIRAGLDALLAVDPLRANWYYDGSVDGLTRLSVWATPLLQNGRLRTYATWTLGGVAVLTVTSYLAAAVQVPPISGITLPVATIIVLLTAVLGALAVARAGSHVAGVLTLSIVGFMVAIFYILARAPDLALTQLVVETLVLVIFLLVLDRLPAFYGDAPTFRIVRDGVLSVAVGGTVFLTVLLATAANPNDALASFFIKEAIPRGGGGNVVNVILVDFRAFDTLGEISVVALAAVSVLTLIGMRQRGETQQ